MRTVDAAAQDLDRRAVALQLFGLQLRGSGHQRRHPVSGLGAAVGVGAIQVIAAGTSMRVEIKETLVLALHGPQQCAQRHVLVNVGEVSGMKAMAILHREILAIGA